MPIDDSETQNVNNSTVEISKNYVVENCDFDTNGVNHIHHFFLQNKGGIGKTTCCSFFAQYLESQHQPRIIYDVDPQNKSLSSYKALNVDTFIFSENNQSDLRKIERLFAKLEMAPEYQGKNIHFVYDIGTSGYNDFYNTLVTNGNIENLLDEETTKVIVHAIIGSGNEQTNDCLLGLKDIVNHTDHLNVKFVYWVNRYWGDFVLTGSNDKTTNRLEFTKIYKEIKEKGNSLGIIYLPVLQNLINNQEIAAYELREMVNERKTFDEVIENCDIKNYLSRNRKRRLAAYKDEIFGAMDAVLEKIKFK